ncbi:F-box/FBD/LRR-repeat protein At5g56420-like [Silene latifolia]|uniref:F-box/FBD/LRR-repeat protein At5g56420-like n=1 Tax=Silene latifolia TaxID=37657 RepID=UPI003D77375A
MKPQKRMRMRSSECDVGLDSLSEMPDQVIVHILSCMPTRDAVRTMLLRRFGKLWTMVHALSFDFNDHYVRNDINYDDFDDVEDENDAYEEEQRIMSEAFSRFARFVRNVLMLHRRSSIDSFHLDIGDYKRGHVDPCLIDDVKVWLEFAIDREVKDLFFNCDDLDDIAPPRCVFTSQSLVTLALYGSLLAQYEHQPQLHMGNLRKLTLCGVRGSNEAFNQLVSACPSLQKLEISYAQGLEELNIGSPVEVDWT